MRLAAGLPGVVVAARLLPLPFGWRLRRAVGFGRVWGEGDGVGSAPAASSSAKSSSDVVPRSRYATARPIHPPDLYLLCPIRRCWAAVRATVASRSDSLGSGPCGTRRPLSPPRRALARGATAFWFGAVIRPRAGCSGISRSWGGSGPACARGRVATPRLRRARGLLVAYIRGTPLSRSRDLRRIARRARGRPRISHGFARLAYPPCRPWG